MLVAVQAQGPYGTGPVQDARSHRLLLVNGTMDGPSPHVPQDAAGSPPPSAATSEAQWR